jgi:hypothetical protein
LLTTWTWGNTAGSYNIGKLQSVTAASSAGTYSEGYVYDSKTRLSAETITIPGDATYTYTSAYNATTGLLDTLQYPVSTSAYQLKLQYAYQNGILQQISDVTTGTHYWTANAINPRGQYTQEALGNSVVVNHTLDAVTGWVSSIQAGVGGGAALQNNSYLFDYVGNLTQRQDSNVPAVTKNVFPDNLYRLDHTVGDTNTQMTYDGMGRISTWAAYGNSTNVNNLFAANSGPYNAGFPDYGSVSGVQTVGYVNAPYSQVTSYLDAYAAAVNTSGTTYMGTSQNSNSYTGWLLAGLGFRTLPAPAMSAPGFGEDYKPIPNLMCTKP